jgi:hypothetical protein
VGVKASLRQGLKINDKPIQAITCVFTDTIHQLTLLVRTKTGIIEKVDIGYVPDEVKDPQTQKLDLPPYQFLRSVTFYGEIVDLADPNEAGKEATPKREAIIQRGDQTFILPENLTKTQFVSMTGIMFDLVA